MAKYLDPRSEQEEDFFWRVMCYEKDGTLAIGRTVERRINGQLRSVDEGILCDLGNVTMHMHGAYAWLHQEAGRVVKFCGIRCKTETMFSNYADVCYARGLTLDGHKAPEGTDQDLIDEPIPWEK